MIFQGGGGGSGPPVPPLDLRMLADLKARFSHIKTCNYAKNQNSFFFLKNILLASILQDVILCQEVPCTSKHSSRIILFDQSLFFFNLHENVAAQ